MKNTGMPADAFERELARALREEAYRVPHHLTAEALERRLERAQRQTMPAGRWLGLAAAVALLAVVAVAVPLMAPSLLPGLGGPAPSSASPTPMASEAMCLRGEYRLAPDEIGPDTPEAREETRTIIERRLDDADVGEATARLDDERILVRLPPEADSERVRGLIGATGRFQILALPSETTAAEGEPVPPGLDVLLSEDRIESVESRAGQMGDRELVFVLDAEGTRLFADHTRANVGERMALAVDGVIISVPVIQLPIEDGSVAISGDLRQVDDLVIVLRHGPLPIPVAERSFGLGACS